MSGVGGVREPPAALCLDGDEVGVEEVEGLEEVRGGVRPCQDRVHLQG